MLTAVTRDSIGPVYSLRLLRRVPQQARSTEVAEVEFSWPREELAGQLLQPEPVGPIALDDTQGTGKILRDYLESLDSASGTLTPDQRSGARRALGDLAVAAVNATSDPQFALLDPAAQQLKRRALAIIHARVGDPELAAASIAAELGVSRARLYRAFENGPSVAQTIRESRLRGARRELVSRLCADLQIAQIAYRWGYADPAHFSRAFLARFDMTPAVARGQRAGEATDQQTDCATINAGAPGAGQNDGMRLVWSLTDPEAGPCEAMKLESRP